MLELEVAYYVLVFMLRDDADDSHYDSRWRDADIKFWRRYPVFIGPPLIERVVVPEDSFKDISALFVKCIQRYGISGDAKKKLQEIMTNPRDQFGLHLLFHGQYSLNKNKRWLIPDTIKENISLMQDTARGLRISLIETFFSMAFGSDFVACRGYQIPFGTLRIHLERNKHALGYHTVIQGREVHRTAKDGLADNILWPPSKKKKGQKVPKYGWLMTRQDDVNEMRQKLIPDHQEFWRLPLHIAYRTTQPMFSKHRFNSGYKRRWHSAGRNFSKSRSQSNQIENRSICASIHEHLYLSCSGCDCRGAIEDDIDHFDIYEWENEDVVYNEQSCIARDTVDLEEPISYRELPRRKMSFTLGDFLVENDENENFVVVKTRRNQRKKSRYANEPIADFEIVDNL